MHKCGSVRVYVIGTDPVKMEHQALSQAAMFFGTTNLVIGIWQAEPEEHVQSDNGALDKVTSWHGVITVSTR